MKLIDGRALADTIKDKIASEIHSFSGPRPGLAIILVGDRPDSALYVSMKEKQAKSVGIEIHVYRCDESIPQEELIQTIDFLNTDPEVDGILLQLPLPEQLDTDTLINRVNPEKDIDGFGKENIRRLLSRDGDVGMMPPVYAAAFTMLTSIDVDLENKRFAILGNSYIFKNNLEEILKRQGAEPGDLEQADIIIIAVGKAASVTADMVKDNAVVIDIGIAQTEAGNICGDVDAVSMEDKPGYMSPVPGGVGPMTIAMAFWNTLQSFKKRRGL